MKNLVTGGTGFIGPNFVRKLVEAGRKAGTRKIVVSSLAGIYGELKRLPVQEEHGVPRPGEVRHSSADASASASVLGYEPLTDFTKGLADNVQWARKELG